MPKIQWSDLPEALRRHLLLRLKERQVTEQDLLKLMEWRKDSRPRASRSKEAALEAGRRLRLLDPALRVALA